MPVHPTHPASMLPALQRERTRNRRLAVGLLIAAAVIWAAVALVTGSSSEQRRQQQEVAPTTALVTSVPHNVWDSSDQTGDSSVPLGDSVVPADEPPADEPQADPDPQPEPEPDPHVPVGGNGNLAPNPTPPTPTCLPDCVAPVELHPFEVDTSNTPANIGFAGADEGGCSTDCITTALVFQPTGTTDLDLEVETHTPAYFKIYLDDEEPSTGPSGHPYFPGKTPVANTTGDLDQWFGATLTDLDEATTYWVIVMATDEQLRTSSVVGSVVTHHLADDLELEFAAIDIIYDGDAGRNKGELDFVWAVGLQDIGGNGTYTRSDGDRIDLSGQVNSHTHMDLGDEELPLLHVFGREKDPGYCTTGGETGAGTNDKCGRAWNTTLPMSFTIADIQSMADCSVFDLGDDYDGLVCTRLATVHSFGGIPEFSVVVAFRLF